MSSVARTLSVAQMLTAIPVDVLALCRQLRAAGKRAWVVGGCVRDVLRGEAAKDWDLATDARPEEVMKIFPRVIPTGLDHGTVTVLMKHVPYELTTLRGEGAYDDGRRPNEVRFLDDIEQDLARRDFTFNAIAVEPLEGTLIDPFGGRADLEQGVLRAVGEARERFAEDGLRLLRAARFAATLQCSIHPDTLSAMAAETSHITFRRVSRERIHDEWLKSLAAARPSIAFDLMQQTGLLPLISGPLAATVGCRQGADHAHDVWTHSLAVLDAVPADPALRLAALLHDIGKPPSRQERGQEVSFPDHAAVGARLAGELMRGLKFSNQHRKNCVHLVRHHHPELTGDLSDAQVRRWLREVGPEHSADVLSLALADWTSKGTSQGLALTRLAALREQTKRLLGAGFALSSRDLAVDGGALMKELDLPPGRRVGELLAELLEWVTEDPDRNERAALLAAARRLLAERAVEAT